MLFPGSGCEQRMDCSAVSVEDILVEDILVAEDGHMETGAVAEAAHIGCSHID